MGLAKIQLHVTHIGHQLGGLQCGHEIWKKLSHLTRTLYIVGIILHPETFLIIYGGAGLDADIDILERRFHFIDVMGVIGDNQRDIQLLS